MKKIRYSRLFILALIALPLLLVSLAMAALDGLVMDQNAGLEAEPLLALEPGALPKSPNTPPPPYGPVGTVKNQGANVPDGTVVTASCNNVVYAQTTTVNTLDPVESWYQLIIPGDDPAEPDLQGCLPGETITFKIGDQTAYQTVPFFAGSELLELTIDEPVPQLDLEKFTNGEDADTPTGPTLVVSSTVTWTYTLANIGNVTLIDVEVWDDYGTPADGADDKMACRYPRLKPNDPQDCLITGTVTLGQYANVAIAGGVFTSTTYTTSDVSHYLGVFPAISLEKSTNGHDADSQPGPGITAGDPVTWTYIVTNTGDVALSDIKIKDDNGTPLQGEDDEDVCTIVSLAPGAASSCQWAGTTAVKGQYGNIGTASVIFGELLITDSDSSHYFGQPDTQYLFLPLVLK